MTDDSTTLRVDRCPVDGHFCQEGGCCRYDDGVLTFAKSRLLVIERQASEIAALLVSQSSWAKEKATLDDAIARDAVMHAKVAIEWAKEKAELERRIEDRNERLRTSFRERAELERQRDDAREAALQEFEDYHDNHATMADAIGEVGPMKYHDNAAKAMREFRHASRPVTVKE